MSIPSASKRVELKTALVGKSKGWMPKCWWNWRRKKKSPKGITDHEKSSSDQGPKSKGKKMPMITTIQKKNLVLINGAIHLNLRKITCLSWGIRIKETNLSPKWWILRRLWLTFHWTKANFLLILINKNDIYTTHNKYWTFTLLK